MKTAICAGLAVAILVVGIICIAQSGVVGAWWPPHFVDHIYAVMALTPQHTYINLSKRPERRRDYLANESTPEQVGSIAENFATAYSIPNEIALTKWPPPNVIEGTSVSC